jgi:hypothetical protein
MVEYVNTGSWTEESCTYATINGGLINLKTFQPRILKSTESRNV